MGEFLENVFKGEKISFLKWVSIMKDCILFKFIKLIKIIFFKKIMFSVSKGVVRWEG